MICDFCFTIAKPLHMFKRIKRSVRTEFNRIAYKALVRTKIMRTEKKCYSNSMYVLESSAQYCTSLLHTFRTYCKKTTVVVHKVNFNTIFLNFFFHLFPAYFRSSTFVRYSAVDQNGKAQNCERPCRTSGMIG